MSNLEMNKSVYMKSNEKFHLGIEIFTEVSSALVNN